VRQYLGLASVWTHLPLAIRTANEGLRVFEVDHPGTQRWKQHTLAETGVAAPVSLTFVPVAGVGQHSEPGPLTASWFLDRCNEWRLWVESELRKGDACRVAPRAALPRPRPIP
jgi:leucine carboxyl methyltransferase